MWLEVDGKRIWVESKVPTSKLGPEPKPCELCREVFSPRRYIDKFCSKKCSRKASRLRRAAQITPEEKEVANKKRLPYNILKRLKRAEQKVKTLSELYQQAILTHSSTVCPNPKEASL